MQHSNVSLMVLGEWEFRPAAIMRLLQTSDCYVDLYLLYQTSMGFLVGLTMAVLVVSFCGGVTVQFYQKNTFIQIVRFRKA